MELTLRNIEIKAKVRDLDNIIAKAIELSGKDGVILCQKDTFYNCPNLEGLLKLREENGRAILISYNRPNIEGPKLSKYKKCQVSDPVGLSSVLEDALGVKGTVEKCRLVFQVGQTRIHIDQVKGLGNFVELKVVLWEIQSAEDGQFIARDLMAQLGVIQQGHELTDEFAGAYLDMLSTNGRTGSSQ